VKTYFLRVPEYWFLPGRLPGPRWYLGSEDFMGYEDNMAYFTINGRVISCLGKMILCATTLDVLLVIGGVEKNPGPSLEAEKILQVLCSGCDRNLKLGTKCSSCGRWFHNSCGNIKAVVAESGKLICDKCRQERLRLLDEKLQNALLQTDDLTRKNKAREEQLRLATAGRKVGRRDMVPCDRKGGECLVLGNSIIRNVGSECSDMKFECFAGIRTEKLYRVIENRDLENPDTVVVHMGTKDLRRTGNFDYVMGDVYDIVNTGKTTFSSSIVALSGVLWRRDVSRRRIGAVNSIYEWVAQTLGVTFVDPIVGWTTGTLVEMTFT
jgi:hypothetical protein